MPLDKKTGIEMPDPRPVAMPVGFERPEPLNDVIRRLVQREVSVVAEQRGMESFEEANNFDTGEDNDDPLTPAEKAAEFGERLVDDRKAVLEAEKEIKVKMLELEKKRKRAQELREQRALEADEADRLKDKKQ